MIRRRGCPPPLAAARQARHRPGSARVHSTAAPIPHPDQPLAGACVPPHCAATRKRAPQPAQRITTGRPACPSDDDKDPCGTAPHRRRIVCHAPPSTRQARFWQRRAGHRPTSQAQRHLRQQRPIRPRCCDPCDLMCHPQDLTAQAQQRRHHPITQARRDRRGHRRLLHATPKKRHLHLFLAAACATPSLCRTLRAGRRPLVDTASRGNRRLGAALPAASGAGGVAR